MGSDLANLDLQIEKLRGGDTLTENEVRALCDKVRISMLSGCCGVTKETVPASAKGRLYLSWLTYPAVPIYLLLGQGNPPARVQCAASHCTCDRLW
jgi:hypothetical protein